jgi:Ni/Co efflux regulator RcnB
MFISGKKRPSRQHDHSRTIDAGADAARTNNCDQGLEKTAERRFNDRSNHWQHGKFPR